MTDVTQQDRFYTLQEVSAQCGLIPYIVRYWQGHFPELGSGAGKTQYTVNDVALLRRIKKLLYGEHLTIEQAKERLSRERAFPVQYPGGVEVRPQARPAEPAQPQAAQPQARAVQPQPQAAQSVEPQPQQHVEQPAAPAAPAVASTPSIEETLADVRGQLDAARQTAALNAARQQQWSQTEQQLRAEAESVKARAAALAAQLEQALARAQAAEEALEAERAGKTAAQTELAAVQAQAASLSGALAAREEELAARGRDLESAREEAADLRGKLEQSTMQAGQSAGVYAALQLRNAELEQKLAYTLEQLKSIAGLFGKNI